MSARTGSTKVVEQHEIGVESDHLCCQCSAPLSRHCHVREDERYPKSEPAQAGNPPIAEISMSPEREDTPWTTVQRIIDKGDPDAFLIDDALDDDGVGTTRVQTHATIRYTIPLPPWVSLADDPGATHVTVFRGIRSTLNTPALDPILLHDGRAPTLQEQALGAIHDHYQNTVEPTAAQLETIAEFQRTNAHFFSSDDLKAFAAGGPPPELPPGNTPAEQRGRTFLVDAPFESSLQERHLRPLPWRSDAEPGQSGALEFRQPGASRGHRSATSTTTARRHSATPSLTISGSSTSRRNARTRLVRRHWAERSR